MTELRSGCQVLIYVVIALALVAIAAGVWFKP